MARMIPRYIDPETKSDAEKKVFRALKEMPDTESWTVLHSVGIANHPTQSQGEADFVVVIPNEGIYVLEVKGGGIAFSNGEWFSRNRYGDTISIKNPQGEASNAMHAFVDYINAQDEKGNLKRVLFGYGVIFPNTEISEELHIPDLARQQIADVRDCADMKSYLLNLATFWKKRRAAIIAVPDQQQSAEIVRLLRPEFNSRVSLSTVIRNMENQIIELTENQQNVFEGLVDNERCLVKGSAGTGKTIIALNFALQTSASGKRTAVFCYNRQLAGYIRTNIAGSPIAVCGSFTEYAEEIALKFYPEKCLGQKESDADHYYRILLPELLTAAFLDGKISPFDCLIVDEAQDLMSEEYLDAFDCLLDGGLSGGNWCFFMDAEKQNLYHTAMTEEKVKEMLKRRRAFFANYLLKDNCRNSIAIIEKLDEWFGSKTKSHLSDEYGCDVEIKSYKKPEAAAEQLASLLNRLKKDGVRNSDIVILSPYKLVSSCARLVNDFRISDQKVSDAIYFSTIQSYKGLESPAVILTDIDNIFRDSAKNVLYVGATRARSVLYIVASDHVGKILNGGKGLNNG